MAKTSRVSKILVILLFVVVAATLTFAFVNVPTGTANAEGDVTLKIYADEGGTVTVNGNDVATGGTNTPVTQTFVKENGASFELKAAPNDGYIFAYWYGEDGKPLTNLWTGTQEKCFAFNEDITFSISKYSQVIKNTESAAIHAKFVKQDASLKFVADPDTWTSETEEFTSNKVVLKSAETYAYKSGQEIPFAIEFIGEKWIDFSANVSLTPSDNGDPTNYGSLSEVSIDAMQVNNGLSGTTFKSTLTAMSALYKANGNDFHRVEFTILAPTFTASKNNAPKSWEVSVEYTLKDEQTINSEKGTVTENVKFDSRLGDVYYLEGLDYNYFYHESYAIEHGKKVEISSANQAQITVPKDIPIVFYAIEKSTVASTLDHEQQTTVYNGGIGISEATEETFVFKHSFTDSDETVVADYKEVAILPIVTGTKTVNNSGQSPEKIVNGSIVKFKYDDTNSILIKISSLPEQKQVSFTITANGLEKQYESYGGEYGFTLNDIKEVNHVSIMPNYGEEYYPSEAFNFKIEVEASEEWQNFISKSSDHIEVIGDTQYPWYLDPAFNKDDETFAFSSGITGLTGTGNGLYFPVSQIGFSVEEKGLFTMEFYASNGDSGDGTPTSKTDIGYKLNSKITPKDGRSTFDLSSFNGIDTNDPYNGFDPSVATDIWFQKGIDYNKETRSWTYVDVLGEGVTELDGEEGWFKFQLSMEAGSTIYIAQAIAANASGSKEGSRLTIRNVAFYSGDAYATWDVEGTAADSEYSVTGMDKKGKSAPGTMLELNAMPTEGTHTFYGWKLIKGTLQEGKEYATATDGDIDWDVENAQFVSYEPNYTYTVGSGCSKIVAVIDTTGTYAVRNGGKLYKPEEVNKALTAAEAQDSKDKQVIVVDTATISDISVPNGVEFIIPYNVRGKYNEMGTDKTASNKISWDSTKYNKPVYTLTLNGTNTVYGKFYVGGVIHYPDQSAQGHTSGAYSQLDLNGTLVVGSKGMLDVYGRVTGKGSITVESNGVLYQPFLILDYAGGTNTEDLFYAHQTPFKRYAMINIQCEGGYTINYGGELFGHASLYFWSAITTLDTQFISYVGTNDQGKAGTTTLINLKKDASAHIEYDDCDDNIGYKKIPNGETVNNTESIGHTTITLTGGATAGYMNFLNMVQTDEVAFSIPYNYALVLQNGIYDMNYSYKLMPGASLTVESGATLNINDSGNAKFRTQFLVYDGLIQTRMSSKYYPSATQLKTASYTTNANFIVNGILNIGEETTFMGVVQSTEVGAKIKIANKNVTLSGIIEDGAKTDYDCNYAKYESSARVWDAAHGDYGVVAILEAGKTYTSLTTDTPWTLEEIETQYEKVNYVYDDKQIANDNHISKHPEGHDLANGHFEAVAKMQGSWAEEHGEEHHYDWTPNEKDGYGELSKDNTHVKIQRQCSALGCDHMEDRELLFKVDSLGEIVYTGSEITESELKALFKQLFGAEGLEEHATFDFDPKTNVGEYDVTITLDSNFACWYNGDAEAYVQSYQLKYQIVKKDVTVEISDQHVTYNGQDQSADSVANKDWKLKEGSSIAPNDDLSALGITLSATGKDANSYDITPSANTSNYNVKFEYKGSVVESVAQNAFVIDKANIKIKANDLESAQDDDLLDVSTAGYSFLEDTHFFSAEDKELFDSKLTYTCDRLSNVTVANYDIVITIQDGFTMPNYNLEAPVSGKYYVRDSIFKNVKVTVDGNESLTVTFDGQYHKLAVTGLADELQAAATISYKYQGADMPTEGFRNAGKYDIEITIKVDGHSNEYNATHTLKIEQARITIKILPQSKVYDGKNAVLTQNMWEKTDGNWVQGTTPENIITLKFAGSDSVKNFGRYNIEGECSDSNYEVTFTDGTEAYSIEKAPLTVTAHNQHSTYGEEPVTVGAKDTYTIVGWVEEAALDVKVSHTVTKTTPWQDGGYAITVSVPTETNPALNNYNLQEVNGTYTIDKRNVTVKIKDQNAVYNFQKSYDWKSNAWELDASTSLADGEQSSVLQVALTQPALGNAGTYAITATYHNDNYNVTFEGSWAKEDENEGKAGIYTIDKKTLTHDGLEVIFILTIGEDEYPADELSVKFGGENIVLGAKVNVFENEAYKSLEYTIEPGELTEVKIYTVTVTINDVNYAGSREFTVEVLTEEGYSKALSDALKELDRIVGDLTADTLTSSEEHFDIVKKVKTILDELSGDDKQAGVAQLERYKQLVETWEAAANISDDVIDTAKDIADMPIKWLFAMAEMSILLAAMYVIGKGGLL